MPALSRTPLIAKLVQAQTALVSMLLSGGVSYDPRPLAPVALADSCEPGNEIEGPMAFVILGGPVTSTVLNLLALPVLALRFGRFGEVHRDAAEAAPTAPH